MLYPPYCKYIYCILHSVYMHKHSEGCRTLAHMQLHPLRKNSLQCTLGLYVPNVLKNVIKCGIIFAFLRIVTLMVFSLSFSLSLQTLSSLSLSISVLTHPIETDRSSSSEPPFVLVIS